MEQVSFHLNTKDLIFLNITADGVGQTLKMSRKTETQGKNSHVTTEGED